MDYANAGKLGVFANAVDRGSLSPSQFVRFSLAKISGETPALPEDYDTTRDPFLLRHYHPPLFIYLVSAVSHFESERAIRSVQLLGALAFILVVLSSYWSLSASPRWCGLLLVSLLALWMSLMLFENLSFHGWEAVWTVSSAALLSRWLSDERGPPWGILLCISLVFVFLTLEIGVVVWVASVLCIFIWPPSKFRGEDGKFAWSLLVRGAAFALLLVVMVWPGSIVKVSFLKIPSLYLYRIWLGEEYASVSGNLPSLLNLFAPILTLGPMALLWLLVYHRNDTPRWGPFLVLGGCYGLSIVSFALRPIYLLPALALIFSVGDFWAGAVIQALLESIEGLAEPR